MTLIQLCERGACDAAVAFIRTRGGSVKAAWEACERVDWIIWFIAQFNNAGGVLGRIAEQFLQYLEDTLVIRDWSKIPLEHDGHLCRNIVRRLKGLCDGGQKDNFYQVIVVGLRVIRIIEGNVLGTKTEKVLCGIAKFESSQMVTFASEGGDLAFGGHDTSESNPNRWDMIPEEVHDRKYL